MYVEIVIVCVIIVTVCIYSVKYNKEVITYVSKGYMQSVIDSSNFFQNMSEADLIARDAKDMIDYMQTYKDSFQTFSDGEKSRLLECIKQANNLTKRYPNLHAIKWKFGKTTRTIEMGMPHTLRDTIILSPGFFQANKNDQVTTLIHEKMHVYQRYFPLPTHKLITSYWGFKVSDLQSQNRLQRNNPDLNSYTYSYNDHDLLQLYNSDTPKNLRDSHATLSTSDLDLPSLINQTEHPYEIMACIISSIIIGEIKHSSTQKWMDSYL